MENQESKVKLFIWKMYRIVLRKIDPFPHLRYARKNNYIFIHIPKTAGTSVLNALNIKFRQHLEWSVLEAADPALFRRCYKFCFVRNPYDRLVSVYTYLRDGGAGEVDKNLHELVSKKYDSFDKFVLGYLDKDNIHEHPLLKPQYLFIYGFNRECKVDFIGRFENISSDFEGLTNKLSLEDVHLPKMNASKRAEFSDYYNNEIKEKVYSLYVKDFVVLGYDKNDLIGC